MNNQSSNDLLAELGLAPEDVETGSAPATQSDVEIVSVPAQPRPGVEFSPLKSDIERRGSAKQEQPIHLCVCQMLAMGRTRKEIAAALDLSEATISNIKHSKNGKARIAEIASQLYGANDVQALFNAELRESVEALVQLRDDANTPKAVKLGAIKEFFDRGIGKPVAFVKSEVVDEIKDPKAERDRLMREIMERQKNLTSNAPATSTSAIRAS